MILIMICEVQNGVWKEAHLTVLMVDGTVGVVHVTSVVTSLFEEKMTELQESRKAQLGDMSDILEKRDSIGKEIQVAPSCGIFKALDMDLKRYL